MSKNERGSKNKEFSSVSLPPVSNNRENSRYYGTETSESESDYDLVPTHSIRFDDSGFSHGKKKKDKSFLLPLEVISETSACEELSDLKKEPSDLKKEPSSSSDCRLSSDEEKSPGNVESPTKTKSTREEDLVDMEEKVFFSDSDSNFEFNPKCVKKSFKVAKTIQKKKLENNLPLRVYRYITEHIFTSENIEREQNKVEYYIFIGEEKERHIFNESFFPVLYDEKYTISLSVNDIQKINWGLSFTYIQAFFATHQTFRDVYYIDIDSDNIHFERNRTSDSKNKYDVYYNNICIGGVNSRGDIKQYENLGLNVVYHDDTFNIALVSKSYEGVFCEQDLSGSELIDVMNSTITSCIRSENKEKRNIIYDMIGTVPLVSFEFVKTNIDFNGRKINVDIPLITIPLVLQD